MRLGQIQSSIAQAHLVNKGIRVRTVKEFSIDDFSDPIGLNSNYLGRAE